VPGRLRGASGGLGGGYTREIRRPASWGWDRFEERIRISGSMLDLLACPFPAAAESAPIHVVMDPILLGISRGWLVSRWMVIARSQQPAPHGQ
jgi:hypothetical protein